MADIAQVSAAGDTGGGNFLIPNGTFWVELIAFAAIFFLLARYIVPPINRAMTARQEAIRKRFADLQEQQERAREAEESFRAQLADARHEAARIREEAREQGAGIIADMRKQAQEEADRILTAARAQLEAERQQAVQQLRSEVGSMATSLAERIVGESLSDDQRQQRIVERFLSEIESQDQSASANGTAR